MLEVGLIETGGMWKESYEGMTVEKSQLSNNLHQTLLSEIGCQVWLGCPSNSPLHSGGHLQLSLKMRKKAVVKENKGGFNIAFIIKSLQDNIGTGEGMRLN